MKPTALLLLCFFLTANFCYAQNLVPNPSFEEHTACPNNGGQLEYAMYWTNPLTGGGSSPDYLNACGIPAWNVPSNGYGYELARSGVAYAAVVTARDNPFNPSSNNIREYLQVQLLDTLKEDVEYCISFYVSACDSMHYVSNNMGVYFTSTEVRDTCYNFIACGLKYTPQFENDSTNDLSSRNGWTEVSGRYKALGGEKFIVIGNFRDSIATVSTYVGWSSIPNFSYAAYYIDDVSLRECDTTTNIHNEHEASKLSVYPNPSNGYYLLNSSDPIRQIQLHDPFGRLIYDEELLPQTNFTLNITDKPNGTYFLSATTLNNTYFFIILKT